MALHSLSHINKSGKRSVRLQHALATDPSLLHPSLFEITPQKGVSSNGLQGYEDQFLRRLRAHTWINDCKHHIAAATDAEQTPFFLFGIHADSPTAKSLRALGLDQKSKGRPPDIVLIDLTRAARERLGHWRRMVPGLLGVLSDLFRGDAPAALAIVDDPFVLQALRFEVLKRYDLRRAITPDNRHPVPASVVLNASPDLLNDDDFTAAASVRMAVETYGSNVLALVDAGLKLKRAFLISGDETSAEALAQALSVAQALVGAPGSVTQLYEFLGSAYEGQEKVALGAPFDHQTPLSKMRAALQHGQAGSQHSSLSKFVTAFDTLCRTTGVDSPSRQLFDESLRRIADSGKRALIVCSSEFICGFVLWRLEHDEALLGVRAALGDRLVVADRREAMEYLSGGAQSGFEHVMFLEPHTDQLLHVLVTQTDPLDVSVLAHLAHVEQLLRRVRIVVNLPGIDQVKPLLLAVQSELERAMEGRVSEIPDLEVEISVARLGVVDLTGAGAGAGGATRSITTATGIRIRAFEGTELAVFEPDSLQVFSRKLAKDLEPGDRICVFSPDFVATVRERLHFTRDAPELLAKYHEAVMEAVRKIPGKDMTAKVSKVRERMLGHNAALDLPGDWAIRHWMDIEHLAQVPRDKVRPQAPRYRSQFLCFVQALGMSEDVGRAYWDFGIFWTRSQRIRNGASFHQVFMSILIDPHGTRGRLSAERQREIQQILETAEQHVMTVTANEAEVRQ